MKINDIFSFISAVGTVIAIYAAYLGIKNTKELKKQRELSLITNYKSILFRACGGVSWCHIVHVDIINTATVPAILQGVSIDYRGSLNKASKSYSPIVLQPNQATKYYFFIDIRGGILDGHYDVKVIFHTNIGDWTSALTEETQRSIFTKSPSDEEFSAKFEELLPPRV